MSIDPNVSALGHPRGSVDGVLSQLSRRSLTLAAWRRHRSLIARRGRTSVHDVYETSSRIAWDWQFQSRRLPSVTARLDRLRAGRSCTYLDAAVHAALYPTAVALTSLLTSPTWRHLAFNADDDQTRKFLHRVADTVTDGYYPTGGQDPLSHHLSTGSSALRVLPYGSTGRTVET